MAKPSEEVCRVYVAGMSTLLDLFKTIEKVSESVKKISKAKSFIKYGILDSIGAELVSLITRASSQIGQSALGSVSKYSASILSAILDPILQILLTAPTAVFSLVAIPHEIALESVANEQRLLMRMHANIRMIFDIITKWANTTPRGEYYEQMKAALPFIRGALRLINDIIVDLTANSRNGNNASINEQKYSQLQSAIKTAIDITLPKSLIDEQAKFIEYLEEKKAKIYSIKAEKINKKYSKKLADLSIDYTQSIAKGRGTLDRGAKGDNNQYPSSFDEIKEGVSNIPESFDSAVINSIYQINIRNLNRSKTRELEGAKLDAEREVLKSTFNMKLLESYKDRTSSQFSYEIKKLGDYLSDLSISSVKAFAYYKESQQLCNNIYNFKSLIGLLITEVIKLLRGFGNMSALSIMPAFKAARTFLTCSEEIYKESVDDYEQADKEVTGSELSISLAQGHVSLIFADQVLASTVTKELMALINSDEVLTDISREYDDFLERLKRIKDWDGRTGVWAVDIANSSISPYIQMIADTSRALLKVPILSFSTKDSDKSKMNALINGIYGSINKLRRHNYEVESVLDSYSPYMSSEGGNLKKILSQCGLLRVFAIGMSVASLVPYISGVKRLGTSSIPSYKGCRDNYPGLFKDDDLSWAAVKEKFATLARELIPGYQENIESDGITPNGTLGFRERLANTDFGRGLENKDLDSNPEFS